MEHRLRPLVIRVEVGECPPEACSRICDLGEQTGLGREVPGQRAALDTRPLGDGTQRRARRPVQLAAQDADVLRRQNDGTWRFAIHNPWGTA